MNSHVQAYMFPGLKSFPVEYSLSIVYSLWLTMASGCQPGLKRSLSSFSAGVESNLLECFYRRNVFQTMTAGRGKVHDQGRFRKRRLFKRTLRLLTADTNH